MSWCGGGGIRPTPGTLWRSLPMWSETLAPGSWTPSPGLAPWAILIWIWSADERYSAVTPKRPEATCLMRLRSESPPCSGRATSALSAPIPPFPQSPPLLTIPLSSPPLAVFAIAADAVQGHGRRAMRLGGDRTQRRRAGGKALDDFPGRLDLIDGNRLGRIDPELEQAAQRHPAPGPGADDLGVLLVGVPVVGAGAVLQFGNRVGRPHMLFATDAPGVFTAGIEHRGQHRGVAKGRLVHADGFFGDLEHAYAFDPAGGAGEILAHGVGAQAYG